MKSIIKDFAKVCYVLLLLISTKALSQESQSFTITPELTKQIVEKYNLEEFKIYPVAYKEVDYKIYVDGEILTEDYKRGLKRLEIYKPGFDEYNNMIKFNAEKREAIKTISQNIDAFLSSDEKYQIKEKRLIDSQLLADKYDIKVGVYVPSINNSIREASLRLYESGSKTNKNDLKIFKEGIQRIQIRDPYQASDYSEYLEAQSELSKIQKTETGRVLSDKTLKKLTYMIDEKPVELNTLSGTFTTFEKTYMLAIADDEDNYIKNELIDTRTHYKSNTYTENYPLIKNSDTGELYYFMSRDFLHKFQRSQNENALLDMVHKLGFKEYGGGEGDDLHINTKTSKVILNVSLYNALKKNPSYLTILDNDKIQENTLTKQSTSYTNAIIRYVGLYKMQGRKMSTIDINSWRAIVIKADKLWNQIYKLQEKHEDVGVTHYRLHNDDTFETFTNAISASKSILTM